MEDKDGRVLCEICNINPATECKGGRLPDRRRGQWLCCKSCKETILDNRLNGRENSNNNGVTNDT